MNGRRRPGARAFTLLELLIALGIVGVLLAVAFAGLRIGLTAWQRGEDHAEADQHVRSLMLTLASALDGAHPYRGPRGEAPERVLLFEGTLDRVALVTQTPPLPSPAPIAFTAVVIALDAGEPAGLVVRQRVLPNWNPFTEAETVLHDPAVTALALRYLDADGVWQETWDAAASRSLPLAVSADITLERHGPPRRLPILIVPLRASGR